MIKQRIISAHSDLKTGVLWKIFLILGLIFLALFLVETFLHPIGIGDETAGAILAFSIILIALGFVLWFFAIQFAKLSKIAEEVEEDESLLIEEVYISDEEPKKQKPTT